MGKKLCYISSLLMKVYVLEESAALLSASLSLCLVGEPDPKAAQLPLRILHRAVSRGWSVRSLGGARKAERERERPSVTCRTVGLGGFCFRWRRMVVCHDECPLSEVCEFVQKFESNR